MKRTCATPILRILKSKGMAEEFWQHNWMINNFNLYLKRKSFFFRKGGMLWIDAVYNFFEDGNIWTWANTGDEITAIKTSPTTEQDGQDEQDGLCGVMDAQMDGAFYEPLIVAHDCWWSQNTDILCMTDEPIFD